MIVEPLVTERLVLRNLTTADAGGAYLRWMNDPAVTRFLESRFHVFSAEDLVSFIESCNADPNVLLCGICLKDDGSHIGNIKIGPLDRRNLIGDIGLAIGDPAAWGKGIAREAIAALSSYGFAMLGLHKITAGAYASNIGSRKAFAAVGFSEEGLRRKHYRFEDGWEDAVMMGKVADA